ncbi:MAG: hypothetical protein HXY27_00480 [Hydrogenophilaceae bacterium]|nr:hypothetical protein [Hydrogenophilaceae bacterium]
MSQDPLLEKMDALLKKHRGGKEAVSPIFDVARNDMSAVVEDAPPPDAWLPVLTDVVVMGNVTAGTSDALSPATISTSDSPPAPAEETEPGNDQGETQQDMEPPAISDSLAEQLMGELEPRLAALLQDKLATQIRNSLDDTVSALFAQLDVNIREIVRETVEDKLGKR